MLIKFITRFIRPLGVFFIFLIACFGIIASTLVRDIDRSTTAGRLVDYATSFENRFYDFRMQEHLDPNYVSPEIVLLKIDDYSLQKIGTWPISRTVYAQMLDRLADLGARVVALDIMFPEKSPSFGGHSPDKDFAEAIQRFQQDGRRVFLGYNLMFGEDTDAPDVPVEMLNDAIMTQSSAGADLAPSTVDLYTFPIEEFISTEVGLGSISSREDSDGVFRQYTLLSNVRTIYYGSLALNAVEAFTGDKNTVSIFANGQAELEINGKILEMNRGGETKIRYVGTSPTFQDLSLYDLVSSDANDPKLKSLFEGKIVFVGSTATGAHDLRPSPLDAKMPGVYSHTNMAHMLLHQYFFRSNNDSLYYSLLILILGMIILMAAGLLQNAFVEAISVLTLIFVSYKIDQIYFLPEGYEIKLFYCFFCFISCYSWSTFWAFWKASREKKQIKGTFARYVAPTVVEEMLKDPDKLKVGGHRMDITCLFSDVRDFTSISEGLSASDLAHSMNFYMSKMTDIIFETKGTVDKYIGDAIVALWGAPLPIGNHAQQAVEAAIRMIETMPEVNEEFNRLNRPEFRVGIGLNSGECNVGNMGSDRIFSYTALGDNMNLGARLEGLCKYYGAQILISEYTLERLDDSIKVRPIDKVIVKGKTTPVGIYEVLTRVHPFMQNPELLDWYKKAYAHFQNRDFPTARNVFEKILEACPTDVASQRILKLCQKFQDSPELVSDDFEVTKMTEK